VRPVCVYFTCLERVWRAECLTDLTRRVGPLKIYLTLRLRARVWVDLGWIWAAFDECVEDSGSGRLIRVCCPKFWAPGESEVGASAGLSGVLRRLGSEFTSSPGSSEEALSGVPALSRKLWGESRRMGEASRSIWEAYSLTSRTLDRCWVGGVLLLFIIIIISQKIPY